MNAPLPNVRAASITVADATFTELWRTISSGRYEAGSVHTEEQFAAALGVSRTPLREAVRRLEDLGLVEREPSRGLRITPLSMAEMLELSTAREAIEAVLIADATRRVRAKEVGLDGLAYLHARLKRVVETGDGELALSVGSAFHEEIRRLSGNATCGRFFDRILLSFERYRVLAADSPERPELIFTEHARILEAMRAGEPDAAAAVMREHLREARELYRRVLTTRFGVA